MKEYLKEGAQVLRELDSAEGGLSSDQATRRLEQYGPNKLAEGKKISLLQRFFKELADPMILILIAAAVISGITSLYSGESFADVIIIM
ncbi:MAG: cation-transporting P-type ATPase, partial [Clostridia bacterium]|nr:cation-transporting P-type ATPase [Clostridia bacterium]